MTQEEGSTTTAGGPAEHPPAPDGPAATPVVFRAVHGVALVAVGFFALCLSPIAFQGGPWFLLFLGPLAVAAWVLRRATVVDAEGLRVRRLVGSRTMPWSQVATLRLADRGWVRAVPAEGAELELPGVRVRDLGRVGEASGGRISAPTPAEAEAAAEHARELEAARLRVARLREQQAAADGSGAAGVEGAAAERSAERSAEGSAEGSAAEDVTGRSRESDPPE